MALMLREMATRYGRSPGGYLWAVAEPVLGIVFIAFIFAALVRTPPMGDSFILFFATGMLPFQLFNVVCNNVARALNFSRALLFYPSVTWIDAVLARAILQVLTDILVMILLFFAFIAITESALILDVTPILIAIGLTIALGMGFGLMNCVLFGFYPVWMNIWAIATRPLFFISGVLFVFEDMPNNIQNYLWYNPLVHITAIARTGFYPNYEGAFASPTYVLIVSMPLICLGLVLLGRYHRDILNR